MDEIWKDIKGYEGKYQISNFGRVKSLKRDYRHKDRILKPLPKEKEYVRVHLMDKGNEEWAYVHRIVAETFIEKKEGCDIVNHLDNNPSNNNVNNLEWTTYKGNIQHAMKQGRMYVQKNIRIVKKRHKMSLIMC
jgi:hypothetical protein